ncbi:MAG: 50S ribosomal protein L4 [Bdellovibrionales bacterium]|nr:50S ribosomal protein L4 [Bdellovibrionales bacterium]
MATAELKLFDSNGKEVGTKEVSADIFSCEVLPHLLHQVVRWQRAKRRAGTHTVLTRAEASGGGRKPWRQKGLGRARAGSNTSPIWVGGGVAHGPKQRDYSFSINRKERRRALCSAISQRAKEGNCFAVTDFGLGEVKTKAAHQVLQRLGIGAKDRAVVVAAEEDEHVTLSLRNIAGVTAMPAEGLNVYDVLNAKYLLLTEKGLAKVEERLRA